MSNNNHKIKLKFDDTVFRVGEFISNGKWLFRKEFVDIPYMDLIPERDIDVTTVLPSGNNDLFKLDETNILYEKADPYKKTPKLCRYFKFKKAGSYWLQDAFWKPIKKSLPYHDLYTTGPDQVSIVMNKEEFIGLIMPIRVDEIDNLI